MRILFLRTLYISISIIGLSLYVFQIQYFNFSWDQAKQFQYRWSLNLPKNIKHNSEQVRNATRKLQNFELEEETHLDMCKGRFDKTRKYRIYEWVWTSKKWKVLMQKFDVCLATQTSLEKVYWILESIKTWKGPISAVIYLISYKEFIILKKMIKFARMCSPDFANYVAIHVAFPGDISSSLKNNFTMGIEKLGGFHCNQTQNYFDYLIRINPISRFAHNLKEIYPQNHMRNIARKTCGTHWTITLDVDIIPSENSATKLQEFYNAPDTKRCNNCAYVLPSFELSSNANFPVTKLDLIAYANQTKARQLHINYHKTGHKATNYEKWVTTNLQEGPIRVSHAVNYSLAYYYEPFYIAPDSIPEFDERFVGYGYTRNSQIDEAMVLGWNFSVLTPIFLIHWGMKNQTVEIHNSTGGASKNQDLRDRQDATNFIRYIELMKELELKKSLFIGNETSFGFDLRLKDKMSILVTLLLDLRHKIRSSMATKNETTVKSPTPK